MTPEEIRREYVEALARAAWENRAPARSSDPAWEQLSGPRRELFQEWGARYADALAAAGLLPTSVEGRYIGRGMLRRTRLVTDWKEPEQ
ncbi:hypothetical protein [Nocardia asiatica]|uniref:hypothetical protein n=1 Tax=Nocardia asiatica TaxID=209252 RepID=UPI0002FDD4AF|nr:hypothetical protein [Nocardia asiatica]